MLGDREVFGKSKFWQKNYRLVVRRKARRKILIPNRCRRLPYTERKSYSSDVKLRLLQHKNRYRYQVIFSQQLLLLEAVVARLYKKFLHLRIKRDLNYGVDGPVLSRLTRARRTGTALCDQNTVSRRKIIPQSDARAMTRPTPGLRSADKSSLCKGTSQRWERTWEGDV